MSESARQAIDRTIKHRIVAVARRLPGIAQLQIKARPGGGSRTNWRGEGNATVKVERDGGGDWRFHESGLLRLRPDSTAKGPAASGTRTLPLRNVLHWRIGEDSIDLGHQRLGADHEVHLVRLVAEENCTDADLVSAEPHPCGKDLYHARLFLRPDGFNLHWHVAGPRKNELLVHAYRT